MESIREDTALEIFKLIHKRHDEGKIPDWLARSMVESLLKDAERGWRVIGITKEALELLRDQCFRTAKGLQRAHILNRAETARTILGSRIPDDPRRVFDFWRKRDVTVLATKKQNRGIGNGCVYRTVNDDGKLLGSAAIGFAFDPAHAGVKLRELWETISDRKIVKVSDIVSEIERDTKGILPD